MYENSIQPSLCVMAHPISLPRVLGLIETTLHLQIQVSTFGNLHELLGSLRAKQMKRTYVVNILKAAPRYFGRVYNSVWYYFSSEYYLYVHFDCDCNRDRDAWGLVLRTGIVFWSHFITFRIVIPNCLVYLHQYNYITTYSFI